MGNRNTKLVEEEEEAIRAKDASWFSLIEEKKLDDVVQVYTEDCVILPPKVPVVNGRNEARKEFKKFLDADVVCRHTGYVTIDVHGPLATSVSTYNVEDNEGNLLEKGKVLNVWRKVGVDWQIYRGTWSAISEEPAEETSDKEADTTSETPPAKNASTQLQDTGGKETEMNAEKPVDEVPSKDTCVEEAEVSSEKPCSEENNIVIEKTANADLETLALNEPKKESQTAHKNEEPVTSDIIKPEESNKTQVQIQVDKKPSAEGLTTPSVAGDMVNREQAELPTAEIVHSSKAVDNVSGTEAPPNEQSKQENGNQNNDMTQIDTSDPNTFEIKTSSVENASSDPTTNTNEEGITTAGIPGKG